MYPIFRSGSVVLFAYEIQQGNDQPIIQLTECFTKELTKYCTTDDRIALLYDAKKCYILSTNGATELCTFSYSVDSRSDYSTSITSDALTYSKVVYTELVGKSPLNYSHTAGVARSSASLIVPFVSQNPPSNICWAASIACIGNYLTSYSITAISIAQSVYGSNWNQGASTSTALDALYNVYWIRYSYYANTAPTDSRIYNNISGGYPVYSRWRWTNGYHAGVIRGIETGSYVLVMDPEYGFIVANKSSTVYSYVSGYSGVTLTLAGYGSMLS